MGDMEVRQSGQTVTLEEFARRERRNGNWRQRSGEGIFSQSGEQKTEEDYLMTWFLEKMADCEISSRERGRSLTETQGNLENNNKGVII